MSRKIEISWRAVFLIHYKIAVIFDNEDVINIEMSTLVTKSSYLRFIIDFRWLSDLRSEADNQLL